MRYKEFSDILKDFLGHARNIHDDKKLPNLDLINQNPDFDFWYRFKKNNKEIDLLISKDGEQIGIEVKYNAGESGENQLSNYIDGLDGAPLVFITMHSTKPPIGKEANKRENIFWLSWHDLYRVFNEYKDDAKDLKLELIKDLMDYLENRKIYYFQGFYFRLKTFNVKSVDRVFWDNRFFEDKVNVKQIKKPIFWEERND